MISDLFINRHAGVPTDGKRRRQHCSRGPNKEIFTVGTQGRGDDRILILENVSEDGRWGGIGRGESIASHQQAAYCDTNDFRTAVCHASELYRKKMRKDYCVTKARNRSMA